MTLCTVLEGFDRAKRSCASCTRLRLINMQKTFAMRASPAPRSFAAPFFSLFLSTPRIKSNP
jgi:hypothetical protein